MQLQKQYWAVQVGVAKRQMTLQQGSKQEETIARGAGVAASKSLAQWQRFLMHAEH